ncbi:tyrosine-protein phosphatase [Kitasatospora sp. NPDC008115]|uniref:tyrosine-protein phosphatase n=1 Tax=Kitasatospora sp. NPDC008115 TaxID=3364022 RepID=UPI0036E27403
MNLVNFRDVASTAGPYLRAGRLYRSAQPSGLTAADLAQAVPGLRSVIDLRGPEERTEGDWDAARELGATVVGLAGEGSPGSLAALPPGLTLGGLYVLMLDHRPAWFASVVAAIADGLPALVNCAAGKDRTGLGVALVLDLVGAGREDIVRDYTATAPAMPAVLAMLGLPAGTAGSGGSAGSAGTAGSGGCAGGRYGAAAGIGGLLDAPAQAIEAFLDALAERGGAEAVLTRHGLTPDHVQRLRAALTA